MINIEDLAIGVLLEAPECSTVVAEHLVRRSARDFLMRTQAWRRTVPVSLTDNSSKIDLSGWIPANSEISDIVSIILGSGNAPLDAVTETQLDVMSPNWRASYSSSPDKFFRDSENNNIVHVSPIPTTGASTEAIMSIKNTTPAEVTWRKDPGLAKGDSIRISGMFGMTEVNDKVYTVTGDVKSDDPKTKYIDLDATAYVTGDGRNYATSPVTAYDYSSLVGRFITPNTLGASPEIVMLFSMHYNVTIGTSSEAHEQTLCVLDKIWQIRVTATGSMSFNSIADDIWTEHPTLITRSGEDNNLFVYWGGDGSYSISLNGVTSSGVVADVTPVTDVYLAIGANPVTYDIGVEGYIYSSALTITGGNTYLWPGDDGATGIDGLGDGTIMRDTGSTATHAVLTTPDSKALGWGDYYTPPNGASTTISGYCRIALRPTMSATQLSDIIVMHHEEAIISGALSEALKMRDTPWFAPDVAVYHKGLYEEAIREAKPRAEDDYTTGVSRVIRYAGL
tara:strand:- start:7732 stop:9255 length:1524 start_codon:yes stop_codon:yes gene_type:complete